MQPYHAASVQSSRSKRAGCWLLSSGFGVESGKAQFSALPPKAAVERTSVDVSNGRVEDGRGNLGHAATLRFPSPLAGRVEDWRAGVGRSLCSLLSRPFVCECHTISTMPRFQPPPRRTQHADFLALRSPVCFASMLMGPILLERLSAAGGEPCSCRTAAGFRTTTAYSTVSSRSPFGSVPAPCGVESSFPPSLESC